MQTQPLTYIVLVNWNGLRDTAECLVSLRNLDYPNFRVIVVDNGSSDDSASRLPRDFPEITLLANETNAGFAAGNNRGIREALQNGADYVWLLNNDTEVDPKALFEMVSLAEKQGAGIVGATIRYFHDRQKVWAMGAVFNVETGDARHIQREKDRPRRQGEISYIPGCSMLISKACLEKVGPLDESYFHLGEDVDYCARALREGCSLAVCKTALVYHKVSSSMTGFSPLYNYYEQRNRLFLVQKYHHSKKGALYVVHVAKRLCIAWIMGIRHPLKNTRYILSGIRDSLHGIKGQRIH